MGESPGYRVKPYGPEFWVKRVQIIKIPKNTNVGSKNSLVSVLRIKLVIGLWKAHFRAPSYTWEPRSYFDSFLLNDHFGHFVAFIAPTQDLLKVLKRHFPS